MPTGEALRALLRELRARFPEGADPRELEIWLASLGYDARQIETVRAALAAESGEASAPSEADGPPPDAVTGGSAGPAAEPAIPALRVAAPYERARFSPEAWGYLMQLRAAGVVGVDFEQLVDRALLQLEGRIGLGELRAVLEGAGGDEPMPAASRTLH